MNTTYIIIFFSLLIWIPWFWRYHINPYFQRKKIVLQLQQSPNIKKYLLNVILLKKLYFGLKAKIISHRERKRLHIKDDSLVYGEIDFLSFISLLEKVQPQPNEVFCDLGCGTGKALLTAALNFDLAGAIGIELLPGLCTLANEQIKKAKTLIKLYDKNDSEHNLNQLACIQIINKDVQDCDLEKCNIVFINATCLNLAIWQKIVEKLLCLQPGSRIIVTSKTIQHEHFQLLYQGRALMSWGMNSVTIYKKL